MANMFYLNLFRVKLMEMLLSWDSLFNHAKGLHHLWRSLPLLQKEMLLRMKKVSVLKRMLSSVLGNVSFCSFVIYQLWFACYFCSYQGFLCWKVCVSAEWGFICLHTCLQHRHERSLLHLHGSDLPQIEGWSHPGVHLIHHLGAVLILHLFAADQILLLSGVVTHLLAGDHYLHLGGALLHHLGGICGNQCLNMSYKFMVLWPESLTLFLQQQSFT